MPEKIITVSIVGPRGRERVQCTGDPTHVERGQTVVWASFDGDISVEFKQNSPPKRTDDPFQESPKVWTALRGRESNVGTVRQDAENGSYFYTARVSRPAKPDIQNDPEIVVN